MDHRFLSSVVKLTRRSPANMSSDVASKGHFLHLYSSRFSFFLLCSDPLIYDKVRREKDSTLFKHIYTHAYNTSMRADKLTF